MSRMQRIVATTIAATILITACGGESAAEHDRRHLAAADSVMATLIDVSGIENPPEWSKTGVLRDCFGTFGSKTRKHRAFAGGDFDEVPERMDKSLIDEIILEFGDPQPHSDRETTLSDRTQVRRLDFTTKVDGIEMSITATVSRSGVFGATIRTVC